MDLETRSAWILNPDRGVTNTLKTIIRAKTPDMAHINDWEQLNLQLIRSCDLSRARGIVESTVNVLRTEEKKEIKGIYTTACANCLEKCALFDGSITPIPILLI